MNAHADTHLRTICLASNEVDCCVGLLSMDQPGSEELESYLKVR